MEKVIIFAQHFWPIAKKILTPLVVAVAMVFTITFGVLFKILAATLKGR